MAAICLVGGTITSIAAAQASNRKPPPVPQCYYTGSGYGLCEGNVIPEPGSVVKLIYPNKKGVFELTGPTPLQWTRAVACGDMGCVYNHLDWSIGTGARKVSDCGVEQSICNVKVGAFYSWAPVYVRQNNNPATLYLLWDSTKVGAFIHGFVRDKKQNNVGVEDVVITAYGTGRTHGSQSDVTGTEGFYEVNVRPGSYKVVPSDGPSGTASPKYDPTRRDVKLGPGGIVTANFDRSALELSSTAVDCVAGDTETAPQNCTVTVSDATATPPLLAPTGSVDLAATSGKLSAASCTLVANSATATGTCTFHYTLPTEDAELLKTPTITATYQGDKVFAKSSGEKLFSCNAAVLLRVTSISSSAPSTNGFRTNAPVTLQGCGFKASAVVRFGADNATARPEPSNVAADGSTMTLTVPDLAITGPLTVTEGKSTATLANPKPVKIDSWRNTNGLSFVNFGGSITPTHPRGPICSHRGPRFVCQRSRRRSRRVSASASRWHPESSRKVCSTRTISHRIRRSPTTCPRLRGSRSSSRSSGWRRLRTSSIRTNSKVTLSQTERRSPRPLMPRWVVQTAGRLPQLFPSSPTTPY